MPIQDELGSFKSELRIRFQEGEHLFRKAPFSVVVSQLYWRKIFLIPRAQDGSLRDVP